MKCGGNCDLFLVDLIKFIAGELCIVCYKWNLIFANKICVVESIDHWLISNETLNIIISKLNIKFCCGKK